MLIVKIYFASSCLLKGLAHAYLAKNTHKNCMNFYCFMTDFSAALISALALLKYDSFGITVVV